jgi:hypothetical protein
VAYSVLHLVFLLKVMRKTSINRSEGIAEIQNEYLPNASLQPYRYTNLVTAEVKVLVNDGSTASGLLSARNMFIRRVGISHIMHTVVTRGGTR